MVPLRTPKRQQGLLDPEDHPHQYASVTIMITSIITSMICFIITTTTTTTVSISIPCHSTSVFAIPKTTLIKNKHINANNNDNTTNIDNNSETQKVFVIPKVTLIKSVDKAILHRFFCECKPLLSEEQQLYYY